MKDGRRYAISAAVTGEDRDAIKDQAKAAGLTVSDYLYRGLVKLGWIRGNGRVTAELEPQLEETASGKTLKDGICRPRSANVAAK